MLRIKEILKEKGLSVQYLSDKVGITYANMNNIVNEKASPSTARLKEIADILGVQVVELFEKQPDKGSNEFTCPNCGVKIEIKLKNEPGND